MSRNFYADLPSLQDYQRIVEDEFYRDLPEDWILILTDIKGSTAAIAEGRYKEVNLIGVSCIVAVQNAMGKDEFPFVFGGDGATLAIPPWAREVAQSALSQTRKIALEQFGLGLRIAIIPVADVCSRGETLRVAKLSVSTGNHLALMRGGGWALAESLLKTEGGRYALDENYPCSGAFKGLECRWNPVPSKKAEVLAIIVQTRSSITEKSLEIYRGLLNEILSQPDVKPISIENLPLGWPPKFLAHEAKLKIKSPVKRWLFRLQIYALTLFFSTVLALRGKKNQTAPIPYLKELAQNTDYLKFDECLRMVVDLSKEQKLRLMQILQTHFDNGEIFFGVHSSSFALMTCFIQGPSQHLHFVDTGGGGYTLAAKQLKAQKQSCLDRSAQSKAS